MNKIINKKGNKGFTVTGWNFSFSNRYMDRDSKKFNRWGVDAYLIHRNEIIKELTVMIRPVTVHSCGKKELKLFSNDTNKLMRGSNYAPDTSIYVTEVDAKQWFNDMWPTFNDMIIKRAKREIDRYAPDGDNAKYKWCEAARKQAIEALRRFESGEITYRFVDWENK